jgi:hypothetical protein
MNNAISFKVESVFYSPKEKFWKSIHVFVNALEEACKTNNKNFLTLISLEMIRAVLKIPNVDIIKYIY